MTKRCHFGTSLSETHTRFSTPLKTATSAAASDIRRNVAAPPCLLAAAANLSAGKSDGGKGRERGKDKMSRETRLGGASTAENAIITKGEAGLVGFVLGREGWRLYI